MWLCGGLSLSLHEWRGLAGVSRPRGNRKKKSKKNLECQFLGGDVEQWLDNG